MNLYLVGYRGAGKSTVAPLLASALGRDWLDMDEHLERRLGGSIADYFAQHGEEAFRAEEERLLEEISLRDGLVVATGGGVVGRQVNRTRLSLGWTAWLKVSSQTIERRLALDAGGPGRRPALTSLPGAEEIRALLAVREPLYREVADVVVDADGRPADAVAADVLDAWHKRADAGDEPPGTPP